MTEKPCGMPHSIIPTGLVSISTPANKAFRRRGMQRNMSVHSWISSTHPTIYFLIEGKLLPYFSRLKVCDIDTIRTRKRQNELISFWDENGKPYSQTYLKTINNQMSAILNYAMKHYQLISNPCKAADSIGKSKAEEMKFRTQEQYEIFSQNIQKSALKLAFDILFCSGIREGELLALTPADILPNKRISITKNYAKVKGEELFLIPKTSKSRRNISMPDFLFHQISP